MQPQPPLSENQFWWGLCRPPWIGQSTWLVCLSSCQDPTARKIPKGFPRLFFVLSVENSGRWRTREKWPLRALSRDFWGHSWKNSWKHFWSFPFFGLSGRSTNTLQSEVTQGGQKRGQCGIERMRRSSLKASNKKVAPSVRPSVRPSVCLSVFSVCFLPVFFCQSCLRLAACLLANFGSLSAGLSPLSLCLFLVCLELHLTQYLQMYLRPPPFVHPSRSAFAFAYSLSTSPPASPPTISLNLSPPPLTCRRGPGRVWGGGGEGYANDPKMTSKPTILGLFWGCVFSFWVAQGRFEVVLRSFWGRFGVVEGVVRRRCFNILKWYSLFWGRFSGVFSSVWVILGGWCLLRVLFTFNLSLAVRAFCSGRLVEAA